MCTNTSYDVGYKKQHKKPSYFTRVSHSRLFQLQCKCAMWGGSFPSYIYIYSTSSLRSSFERSGRANDHSSSSPRVA
eukprot:scaffold2995_cov98-Skeletonema_dohrnii-CCMP3373.AAC.2